MNGQGPYVQKDVLIDVVFMNGGKFRKGEVWAVYCNS